MSLRLWKTIKAFQSAPCSRAAAGMTRSPDACRRRKMTKLHERAGGGLKSDTPAMSGHSRNSTRTRARRSPTPDNTGRKQATAPLQIQRECSGGTSLGVTANDSTLARVAVNKCEHREAAGRLELRPLPASGCRTRPPTASHAKCQRPPASEPIGPAHCRRACPGGQPRPAIPAWPRS